MKHGPGVLGFLGVVLPFTETASDNISQQKGRRAGEVQRGEYEADSKRGSDRDRASGKKK